jgi:hypothetical protein
MAPQESRQSPFIAIYYGPGVKEEPCGTLPSMKGPVTFTRFRGSDCVVLRPKTDPYPLTGALGPVPRVFLLGLQQEVEGAGLAWKAQQLSPHI